MQLLIFIFFISRINSQSLIPCRQPIYNPGLQIICNNVFGWAQATQYVPVATGQSTLPKTSEQPLSDFAVALNGPALAAGGPPSDRYQCMNWQCVCNFIRNGRYVNGGCQLPGGGTLSRRPRVEYRLMSDAARALYARAVRAVFSTIYRTLARAHSDPMLSPGAHSGPSFLPWHRELLKRMEIGIRTTPVNGAYPFWSVTIPYWDNTMDADIFTMLGSEPTSSVMFSSELIGSVQNGFLTDGPFANWAGQQGRTLRQLDRFPGELLLMSREDVDNVVTTHSVNQVLAATAGDSSCPPLPENTLELIHGSPHVWIGGNMQFITTSTNDPIFFLHHSYIDFVWEGWRTRRQRILGKEELVSYLESETHLYDEFRRGNRHVIFHAMQIRIGLINSDGLSNIYTQIFYNYGARPVCSARAACPSRFLWCYVPGSRCVARVRANQACRIISGVDPCYRSRCSSRTAALGRCTPTQRRQSWNATAEFDNTPIPVPDKDPYETCFNNNECCEMLAKNNGCSDPKVKEECSASCKVCETIKEYGDECEDRHHLCKMFKKDGYCTMHHSYMAENCRASCNLCSQTRAEVCTSINVHVSTKKKDGEKEFHNKIVKHNRAASFTTGTCHNMNICCHHWKKTIGCTKMGLMQRECAASCLCKPNHDLNACNDFYNNCGKLKEERRCYDPHVQENCRRTCGSCPTESSLERLCG